MHKWKSVQDKVDTGIVEEEIFHMQDEVCFYVLRNTPCFYFRGISDD